MEWPTYPDEDGSHDVLERAPHLCGRPGCPGPKLVAKLEAAEDLARACRAVMRAEIVCPEDLASEAEQCREAVFAWEKAK